MQSDYPDELDCDFAQFYNIIDRQALPVRKSAVLADGLFFVESRIKKQFSEAPDINAQLLAIIADGVNAIAWQLAARGGNKPKRPDSILLKLIGENKHEKENRAFDSAEEFEAERERILREVR